MVSSLIKSKKGGRLVIMETKDESLRETADDYETLRDPSHQKCLSARIYLIWMIDVVEVSIFGAYNHYRRKWLRENDICQRII